MNVCMVAATYHPKVGGAETYARTIAEGLGDLGHQVTVLTDGAGYDWPRDEELGGVQVRRAQGYAALIDDRDKVKWEQMYFALLEDFGSLLNGCRVDIVHVNSLDTVMLGCMLSLSLKVPLVCSFHEQDPDLGPFGDGKCELIFSRLPVDLFVAGSEFYYQRATAYGAEQSRVRLVYHGVNLNKFRSGPREHARIRFGIGADDYFVVCAARLTERKGLLELIRALRCVVDSGLDARAVIAGSSNSGSRPYANALYAEIEKQGLRDRIRIIETLSLEDMPDLYAAADLVVQPSLREGLGIAVLEGMASGKPVIGSDILGIREIITHGRDGLLVPPQTVQPLAEAILRVGRNKRLADRLAQAGLTQVRSKFNIDQTVRETERAYLELLDRG